MKTFKQFIAEKEYRNVPAIHQWGVIHPKGYIISGEKHPHAQEHKSLIKASMSDDNKKYTPKHYEHYTHYSDEHSSHDSHDNRLSISGYAHKKAVGHLIKQFHNLPHTSSKHVAIDMWSRGKNETFFGDEHKDKVLHRLKDYHKNMKD